MTQPRILPALLAIIPLLFNNVYAAQPSDEHRQRTIQGLGQSLDENAANYLRKLPGDVIAGKQREVAQLRIAQQYGLGYLPLMIARQLGLIEKHARNLKLAGLTVVWSRYPSGEAMNNALESGFLDVASGGISPLLRAWARSQGGLNIVGLAALSSMPLFLNVLNPRVKALEDFSLKDRIALPSRSTSTQALLLRMAVADRMGLEHARALDAITVAYSHPEAMQHLLRGEAGVTAHFASPPFQFQETEDARVRTILSSHDIMGGPFSFSLLWTRGSFQEENPLTVQAVKLALEDAMRMIEEKPAEAASIYLQHSQSSMPAATIQRIISNPLLRYSLVPENTRVFAERMRQLGEIRAVPENWSDLFGTSMQGRPGS